MKLYNVGIRIEITQIGELPDRPETEAPKPFNDDPLDKQSEMLDKYLGKMAAAFNNRMPGALFIPGVDPDGQRSSENVRIVANTFEELQSILARFHEVAKNLPAAPDSLIRDLQNPNFTPIR